MDNFIFTLKIDLFSLSKCTSDTKLGTTNLGPRNNLVNKILVLSFAPGLLFFVPKFVPGQHFFEPRFVPGARSLVPYFVLGP